MNFQKADFLALKGNTMLCKSRLKIEMDDVYDKATMQLYNYDEVGKFCLKIIFK